MPITADSSRNVTGVDAVGVGQGDTSLHKGLLAGSLKTITILLNAVQKLLKITR